MKPSIVLASASPRRKDLLNQIGVMHHILPVDIDETPLAHESPTILVQRLAQEKARKGAVMAKKHGYDLPVLAADTVVVYQEQALGKPNDGEEHLEMLLGLSNTTHQVITCFCLKNEKQEHTQAIISDVTFCELSEHRIREYWRTGEPADKAGGYAIQGYGAVFVKQIKGSYTAVVGLPLFECAQALNSFGVKV